MRVFIGVRFRRSPVETCQSSSATRRRSPFIVAEFVRIQSFVRSPARADSLFKLGNRMAGSEALRRPEFRVQRSGPSLRLDAATHRPLNP